MCFSEKEFWYKFSVHSYIIFWPLHPIPLPSMAHNTPWDYDKNKWTNLNLLKNTDNISTILNHLSSNSNLVLCSNNYKHLKLFFLGCIVPSSVEISSMVLVKMMEKGNLLQRQRTDFELKSLLESSAKEAIYNISVPCTTTSHNSVKTSITWYSAGYDTPATLSL